MKRRWPRILLFINIQAKFFLMIDIIDVISHENVITCEKFISKTFQVLFEKKLETKLFLQWSVIIFIKKKHIPNFLLRNCWPELINTIIVGVSFSIFETSKRMMMITEFTPIMMTEFEMPNSPRNLIGVKAALPMKRYRFGHVQNVPVEDLRFCVCLVTFEIWSYITCGRI